MTPEFASPIGKRAGLLQSQEIHLGSVGYKGFGFVCLFAYIELPLCSKLLGQEGPYRRKEVFSLHSACPAVQIHLAFAVH